MTTIQSKVTPSRATQMSRALIPVIANKKTQMFVTVLVGGNLFGFPVNKVKEIFYVDRIFSVPQAPAEVAGLINLRGRIILVTDMRKWLGIVESENKEDLKLCVVIENGDAIDGLLVDEIGDILDLPVERACPVPPSLDARWKQICMAVHPLESQLMLEADPTSLFARMPKPSDVAYYLSR